MVVRRLYARWCFPRWQRKYLSKLSHGQFEGRKVYLVLPQTMMNRSGEAVSLLYSRLNIPLDRLLVVYDDLDLPLGTIRVRREGGPGTHRGMQSIIEALGKEGFPRLRIGIGPLPEGAEAAEFVLAPFSAEERIKLDPCLEAACQAVEMIVTGHIDQAMNQFNRKQA